MRCLCFNKEKDSISAAEAIELINERTRHIATQISYLEHQMRNNAKDVRRFMEMHFKDIEQARIFMKRIRMLKEKRTRYLQVREKLWAMAQTLEEQSMYNTVQETFQSGVEVMDTLLKKVNVEKIEEMMDRFEEQADETRQVSEALSTDVYLDGDEEDNIERELQMLMKNVEEKEEELPTIDSSLKEKTEKEKHVSKRKPPQAVAL